jgi:hypothetical protein
MARKNKGRLKNWIKQATSSVRSRKNAGDRKNSRRTARRERRAGRKVDRQARRIERMNTRNAARLARKQAKGGGGSAQDIFNKVVDGAAQIFGKGQDALGMGQEMLSKGQGVISSMGNPDVSAGSAEISNDKDFQPDEQKSNFGIIAIVVIAVLYFTGTFKKLFK